MIRIYLLFLSSIIFTACGVHVKYLGETSTPTSKVDVFVDASSIRKSYTIIGKGYIESIGGYNIEKVQKKATILAREKGADAILFQDYYVTEDRATVYGVKVSDSLSKRFSAVKTHSASPVVSSTRDILFLKYE